MPDIAPRVIATIAKELALPMRPAPAIVPDSHLCADLDCNSMDIICFTVALDEAFGIEIPDDAIAKWEFVRDVIATVAQLVGVRVGG